MFPAWKSSLLVLHGSAEITSTGETSDTLQNILIDVPFDRQEYAYYYTYNRVFCQIRCTDLDIIPLICSAHGRMTLYGTGGPEQGDNKHPYIECYVRYASSVGKNTPLNGVFIDWVWTLLVYRT